LYPSLSENIITYTREEGSGRIVKSARSRARAYGAPSADVTYIDYTGSPAYRSAAYRTVSKIGGSITLGNPVPSSGNVASITQQVGE
jgi:hypothetical protein